MADALGRGCRHVITCGVPQSNHCRATSVAARQLGLTPHLILRTDVVDAKSAGCEGNMLLDRLCGSHIYLVPWHSSYRTHMEPRVKSLAQCIKSLSGEDSYHIPTEGSDKIGVFGYFTLFEEMRQQGVLEQFDDLFFACSSGGMAESLAIGNYLTGGKLRLHAIAVKFSADFHYDSFGATLAEMGLGHLEPRHLMRVVEGYIGKGYGLTSQEGLEFVEHVANKTGIILDPVYTGKAALGMVQEMQTNPGAFKGRRVLFLHTGGIFGLFGRMEPHLERDLGQRSPIHAWPDVEDCPLRDVDGDAAISLQRTKR